LKHEMPTEILWESVCENGPWKTKYMGI